MKPMFAIPLDVAQGSAGKKPSAPKVPLRYGQVLKAERERLRLSQHEVAELAGYADYLTVWRLENGHKDGSVKAAFAIREALTKNGANLPAVPVGEEDWQPSSGEPQAKQLADPTEENIRRNLVRFRERIGMDQFAAAFASHIDYEIFRAFELGDQRVSMGDLAKIATAFGCRPGDFFEDRIPEFDEDRQSAFYYGGRGSANLTEREKDTLRKIAESVTERTKKSPPPTGRKRR